MNNIFYGFKDLQKMLASHGLPSSRQFLITAEASGLISQGDKLKFHQSNSEDSISTEYIRIYSEDAIGQIIQQVRNYKLQQKAARETA